tara:strand:- start:360 stop:707 length:348 start_codon:yes stop_codon:yes gene_type:complete
MLISSHEHAESDMELRALKEAQLEAAQLIDAIATASEVDGKLLEEHDSQRIATGIARLEKAVAEENVVRIHELTEQLNRISSDFAARRMDLHIAKALRGESIDDVEHPAESSENP